MIINSKPDNPAVLSNVGAVNNFTIKSTAASFRILSSGLYANKIRAVIRELSCNAYDSHVAAGRTDTLFDVHLPNRIEPWFSVRDYGVGLSHKQVVNIYTTYFESTKTNSNDFIGALGLGSKSPFSYTENFTVTAVHNGTKGVYTAFINDQGVPSIALMATEHTDEHNGVEVKFGVDSDNDFWKFKAEAQEVYRWFRVRPRMTGSEVQIHNFRDHLEQQDVYPGIHILKNNNRGYEQNCVALMGNIAYPIDMPNASANLGSLEFLLNCGLLIEFEIGEVDFQASREGLSYVPSTINAIRIKLEQLNGVLLDRLAEELKAMPNLWDQASHLIKRSNIRLWRSTVELYIKHNPNPLLRSDVRDVRMAYLKLNVQDLQKNFNVKLQGFHTNYRGSCAALQPCKDYYAKPELIQWEIDPSGYLFWVVQDTKVGCVERAKNHFRNNSNRNVLVISAADRTQPMLLDQFLASIHNPPADTVIKASELPEIPRKQSIGKNVSLLRMGWQGHNYRDRHLAWQDAGTLDQLSDTETYYYLPLTGFTLVSKYGCTLGAKELVEHWQNFANSQTPIYGVRKKDIVEIEALPNWINLEDHLVNQLKNLPTETVQSWVLDANDILNQMVQVYKFIRYVDLKPNSEFVKFIQPYCKIEAGSATMLRSYRELCTRYNQHVVDSYDQQIKATTAGVQEMLKRYPMMQFVHAAEMRQRQNVVIDYINQIDQK